MLQDWGNQLLLLLLFRFSAVSQQHNPAVPTSTLPASSSRWAARPAHAPDTLLLLLLLFLQN
jgi:hypothetical protein